MFENFLKRKIKNMLLKGINENEIIKGLSKEWIDLTDKKYSISYLFDKIKDNYMIKIDGKYYKLSEIDKLINMLKKYFKRDDIYLHEDKFSYGNIGYIETETSVDTYVLIKNIDKIEDDYGY